MNSINNKELGGLKGVVGTSSNNQSNLMRLSMNVLKNEARQNDYQPV